MANLNLSSDPVASRSDSLLNVAGAASVAGNRLLLAKPRSGNIDVAIKMA